MKKSLLLILSAAFVIIFSGCKVRKTETSESVKIICSIFPEYDWARNIIGEGDTFTSLSLLEKNGMDLHTYKPSEDDLRLLSSCNLLMYTGGKSDNWITEQISKYSNPPEILNLMEITGTSPSQDEHIWLSIKNAKTACKEFTNALCILVPQNAETYKSRLEAYLKQLDAMDSSFKGISQNNQNKTLLICDKFPFKCFFDEYGFNYLSAYENCGATLIPVESAEILLAETLKQQDIKAVIVVENSDKKIARNVIGLAKRPECDTFTLDSMQNVTLRQAFAGVSYVSLMQKNLETIQKSLK